MRYDKPELQEQHLKLKRRRRLITGLIVSIILLSAGGIYLATHEDVVKDFLAKKQNLTTESTTFFQSAATTKPSSEEVKSSDTKSDVTKEQKETKKEKDPLMHLKGKNYNEKAKNYVYSTKEIQDTMTGQTPYKEKVVFLTFDDGPNMLITPKILDVLKEKEVPATFFVVGSQISGETKEVLEREIKEGHGIAMHSLNHDYQLLYPGRSGNPDEIIKQAEKTQQLLKKQLGADFETKVWRYPGGHMSWQNLEVADKRLNEKGIHWMDWNSAVGDAVALNEQPKSVPEMVAYLKKSLTEFPNNGVHIILMHDAVDKELTLQSLPEVIDYFKGEGFKFGIFE